MKLVIDIPEYEYRQIKEYYEKNDIVQTLHSYIYHGIPLEQEPCEDMEGKIEKEYLFESLCEDLKKLQAENENLRNAIEQEPCEDCISRDMALEKMSDYVASGNADSAEDFEEYSKIICRLPSVQPKTDVFDKIKAEMEDLANHKVRPISFDQSVAVDMCIKIIEKYRRQGLI